MWTPGGEKTNGLPSAPGEKRQNASEAPVQKLLDGEVKGIDREDGTHDEGVSMSISRAGSQAATQQRPPTKEDGEPREGQQALSGAPDDEPAGKQPDAASDASAVLPPPLSLPDDGRHAMDKRNNVDAWLGNGPPDTRGESPLRTVAHKIRIPLGYTLPHPNHR
jgi:hypothetical protein